MKTGMALEALAAEVKRQHETKTDFVANTKTVGVQPRENGLALVLPGHGSYEVRDLAHQQIAAHTKIPAQYYDRMRKEAPDLLANNVETWFDKHPAPRMFRMLDGKNRAMLSDSFRPLDNYDFANVILQAAAERDLDVVSCDITETRLYIKAIDKQEFEVPVGYKMGDGSHRIFDVCCPAFVASNSEVGFGRLTLETGVYTSACTNLAWFAREGFRKTHLGSRHKLVEATGVENIDHLLSHRTRQKSDEALWLQVRDVLKSAFLESRIAERVKQLADAAEAKIEGEVVRVVQAVADRYGLTEKEGNSVLDHLIRGGNLSKYGLHAAVTRSAQDVDDYDRATELEYLGSGIIELPKTEWTSLMDEAAASPRPGRNRRSLVQAGAAA
jgi:hypothetical protein